MSQRVQDAIAAIKQGKMIIVVDDAARENEGDLICSAEMVTAEQINFMAMYGRGLICLALPSDQISRLELPLMRRQGRAEDAFRTAFTFSIDASRGVTTGISAEDRAETIRIAMSPSVTPADIVVPGHVFPLRAVPRGVLERPGHTEAAVDFTRLAGLRPGGVICEIMKPDGTMMRLPDLEIFAKEHGILLVSIEELIAYRQDVEGIQRRVVTTIPTQYGTFNIAVYQEEGCVKEHLAIWQGDLAAIEKPLVRIHSECITGDLFGSLRCDCGSQLHESFRRIAEEGVGLLIYLRQEGRGIGLIEKLKSYVLQDQGLDTVEANLALGFETDAREYSVALKILKDFNVSSIRFLTNNPDKLQAMEPHFCKCERIELHTHVHDHNATYLQVKAEKMGHMLPHIEVHK